VALARVSSGGATADNVALTSSAGDLVIVFAFRSGNATPPSLPSGSWNNIATVANSAGGTNSSARMGWRIGALSTTDTWTNATHVRYVIYSGAKTASPIGNVTSSGGNNSGTLITYAAVTLTGGESGQWMYAGSGRSTADAITDDAPSGMTALVNGSTASGHHDTNGIRATNWPSTDVTGAGGSAKFVTIVAEILAEPDPYLGNVYRRGNFVSSHRASSW
jgi:hypothetical protein